MSTSGNTNVPNPSERWQRIRRLFKEALEITADERDAFVERECGDDASVASELRRLLAAGDIDDSEFANIVSEAAARATELTEQRVGNYRLIELLGTGGMGNVYLAERDDQQFEHRVAIKLLHPGRRDAELLQRFRTERQMLANLEHPNIARLLDGGETATGIPYLVMEYVDGVPIDEYCDARQLTLQQRLRIFKKVCAAIDYAHRNLVVHRDIKPSNILVTADGEPKLLDFGIGKFLDESAAMFTVAVTREGAGVMTPAYASPEQIRSQPVSTATDIYSLGVLLYKMLCGRMPYDTRGVNVDLARAILEYEPTRPSAAVTSHVSRDQHRTVEEIVEARRTSVVRLRKRLRGDLDNIVLMALRKEPIRRYASARALAGDIDNFLTHRPVTARPGSIAYVTIKFLRRYRLAVSVSALLLAVLAASVVQILEQRNRATIAASQAEQVVAFLGQMYSSASPLQAQGEEITARDLLAAAVEEIDALDEQPEVQARLLEIMGSSYNVIGDFPRAGTLLERALAIREDVLPHDPAAIASTLSNLGENQRTSRELEAAEQTHLRALALLEEAFGEKHERIAYLKGRIGDVLRMQHREPEALVYLEDAVDMKKALGQADDADAIDIYSNLALVLDGLGRLNDAEAMNRRAVDASRDLLGSMNPNTVIRIGNLGLIQMRRGNYAEAEGNIDKAYTSVNEIWDNDAYRRIWIAIVKGNVLRDIGKFDAALEAYDEVMEIAFEHYGENSWRHASALRLRGIWHVDMAEYEAALEALNEAVAIARALDEDPGRDIPRASVRIAQAEIALGNPAAAEDVAKAALQSAPLPATTRLSLERELAASVSRQGRVDEATPMILASVRAWEDYSGPESVGLLPSLIEASGHFRRSGDAARALDHAARAAAIAGTITPDGNWQAALVTAEHGRALAAAGRTGEAEVRFRQAAADLAATFGAGDPRVVALETDLLRLAVR
jgi:serine/threonine-protein kinase